MERNTPTTTDILDQVTDYRYILSSNKYLYLVRE